MKKKQLREEAKVSQLQGEVNALQNFIISQIQGEVNELKKIHS